MTKTKSLKNLLVDKMQTIREENYQMMKSNYTQLEMETMMVEQKEIKKVPSKS